MSGRPRRGRLRANRRLPRTLHPLAWWIWAIGMATAVSQTTNPLLLALALAVLGIVVANRRGDSPWSRTFKYYLYLALAVAAIRVVSRVVFGGAVNAASQHVWLRLPYLSLPSWAASVQLGGPVTAEAVLSALYGGLRLGCLLCCIGAANSLANPKRALRVLPGALYELGVAVVVALTAAPQLIESVQRVRRARKLRGGAGVGLHSLREVGIPVLQDALDRSLRLAAAMDCRGYGRTGTASPRSRRFTGGLMITGMCGLCVGAYGLLDPTLPALLGLPALAGGSALCVAGLVLGGRRVGRSNYRPDRWLAEEWAVCLLGLIPAVVFLAGAGFPAASLNPPTDPLTWPTLPAVPAAALLVGALAAVAAPPPIRSVGPARAAASQGPEDDPESSDRHGNPDDVVAPRPGRRRVPA